MDNMYMISIIVIISLLFIFLCINMILLILFIRTMINKATKFYEDMYDLKKKEFYLNYSVDENDILLLDNIINNTITEYKILNFEYEDNLYINTDMVKKMEKDILKSVMMKISPIYKEKLSYIYNDIVIEDEILKKIRFAILDYVTEVNGNYKE